MIFDTSIHDNEIVAEGIVEATIAILGIGFLVAAIVGREKDMNGKYRDKIIKKWNERYKANVIDGKYNQPLRYIEEISHCGYTVEDIKKLAKNAEVKESHSDEIYFETNKFNEDIWWANDGGNVGYANDIERLKQEFRTKFADKVTIVIAHRHYIIGWTGSGVMIYDPRTTHAEDRLILSKVESFAKLQADSEKVCKERIL